MAKKKAKKKAGKKRAGKSEGMRVVVPRASVGAAVQGAVSGDGAKRVTAVATTETAEEYEVTW